MAEDVLSAIDNYTKLLKETAGDKLDNDAQTFLLLSNIMSKNFLSELEAKTTDEEKIAVYNKYGVPMPEPLKEKALAMKIAEQVKPKEKAPDPTEKFNEFVKEKVEQMKAEGLGEKEIQDVLNYIQNNGSREKIFEEKMKEVLATFKTSTGLRNYGTKDKVGAIREYFSKINEEMKKASRGDATEFASKLRNFRREAKDDALELTKAFLREMKLGKDVM